MHILSTSFIYIIIFVHSRRPLVHQIVRHVGVMEWCRAPSARGARTAAETTSRQSSRLYAAPSATATGLCPAPPATQTALPPLHK